MASFTYRTILLTGGTGSFGMHFLKKVAKEMPWIEKLVIFSRDEYKQAQLMHLYKNDKRFVFVLGDVRDAESIDKACKDIDVIIHAAALKHVDMAERNPSEFIKTNIAGTENVLQAANKNGVKKFILISTDKAVAPVGVYGSTKQTAEKLVLASNAWSQTQGSVIRYGNLLGSRGSVYDYLKAHIGQSFVTITDPTMKRFVGSGDAFVTSTLQLLSFMKGGEIMVPILPAFKLEDLVKAVDESLVITPGGLRPGERKDEILVGTSENLLKIAFKDYFLLLSEWHKLTEKEIQEGIELPEDFTFTTENCPTFLTKSELRLMLNRTTEQTTFSHV